MYKFLIIDDDDTVRKYLRFSLKKIYSCNIFEADNGKQGIELLNAESPNLVFLDISMPGMNGIQTLEKIRHESKYADVPVIVLTANSHKEIVSELLMLGISNYLLKPSSIIEIQDRVNRILPSKKDLN